LDCGKEDLFWLGLILSRVNLQPFRANGDGLQQLEVQFWVTDAFLFLYSRKSLEISKMKFLKIRFFIK